MKRWSQKSATGLVESGRSSRLQQAHREGVAMAGVHRHMHCAHVTSTGHYQPGELGDRLFVQRKGLVKAENMAVAVDQQHWDFGLRRQGQQSFANAA